MTKPTNSTILTEYTSALSSHDNSPPLAAVSALLTSLSKHRITTAAETLSSLDTLSQSLYSALRSQYLASQPQVTSKDANGKSRIITKSILSTYPAKAGADLYQRLLVTTLQRPQQQQPSLQQASSADPTSPKSPIQPSSPKASKTTKDDASKAALLQLSKSFISQGLDARKRIKEFGRTVIGDEQTILIPLFNANSNIGNLVKGMLEDAIAHGRTFDVVFILSSSNDQTTNLPTDLQSLTQKLETANVLVSKITEQQVPSTFQRLVAQKRTGDVFILTEAAALLANGGALLTEGTRGVFSAAKENRCNVWCAGEGRGCLRWFPLNGEVDDLQSSGNLKPEEGNEDVTMSDVGTENKGAAIETLEVVPPELVTGGYLTEVGVLSPSAVAEEVLRLWC